MESRRLVPRPTASANLAESGLDIADPERVVSDADTKVTKSLLLFGGNKSVTYFCINSKEENMTQKLKLNEGQGLIKKAERRWVV